jgi:hypothetical protein
MTIGVWNLPKVAFFFESGITLEIQGKKLSKTISLFTFCLAFCVLPSPLGY